MKNEAISIVWDEISGIGRANRARIIRPERGPDAMGGRVTIAAVGVARLRDGREYRISCERYAPRPLSGEKNADSVQLYRNGRAVRESAMLDVRAAALVAFRNAYGLAHLADWNPADPRWPVADTAALRIAPETVSESPAAKVESVVLDMNWRAASGIIRAALENGTGEGKRAARIELERMADLADERNELSAELARRESADFAKAESDVIAEYPLRGDGCQAAGAIVLRQLPESSGSPFVVHFRNDDDSARTGRPCYYHGDYCQTLADGWQAFGDKVKRYDPTGALCATDKESN